MKNSLTSIVKSRQQHLLGLLSVALGTAVMPLQARAAASFGSNGDFSINGGLQYVASRLSGSGIRTDGGLRNLILSLLATTLDYVTLAAMITVIIAGIYLILSNGDESRKDLAKKIITYTAIGLVVILLSRIIVVFFSTFATN